MIHKKLQDDKPDRKDQREMKVNVHRLRELLIFTFIWISANNLFV